MKTIALPSMLGLLLCLHTTPAQAIPETWVASNGAGAACTRVAPCATFAAAHTATDIGGTIKCVDAGNFGPVTITKSITIDCTGTNGGISITSGNAVNINTASVVVTLRGLPIDGGAGGNFGVDFINGSALHIENCRISGFQNPELGAGIFLPQGAGTAKLFVTNSVFSNNGFGILVRPNGPSTVRAVFNRVQVENNLQGIVANGSSSGTGTIVVQVRDSAVAGNTGNGIAAFTNTAFTAFVVDRTSSLLNGSNGIFAEGAAAVVHIGSSSVIGNGGGLIVASGGQILSYQNNQATGNGLDGAPTGVLTVK